MRPRTVAVEVASQQCFLYLGIVPAEVSTPGLQPGDLKGQQGSEGEEPSQKLLSYFPYPMPTVCISCQKNHQEEERNHNSPAIIKRQPYHLQVVF